MTRTLRVLHNWRSQQALAAPAGSSMLQSTLLKCGEIETELPMQAGQPHAMCFDKNKSSLENLF